MTPTSFVDITQPAAGNIPYLDGWRGLAIACVLVGHFGGRPATNWLGPFGVALFFALSGYLMSELLFVKKVALPDFFARRISRVVPTFWLYVLCMVLLSFAVPGRFMPDSEEVLATLLFARTYVPADVSMWANSWPIGHIWSLNVEEHSYLYLALVAMLGRKVQFRSAAPWFLLASVLLLLAFALLYVLHPPVTATPWRLRSEVAAIGIVAPAAFRFAFSDGALFGRWRLPSMTPLLAFVLAAICISTYAHKRLDVIVAPLCLAFTINQLVRVPAFFIWVLSSPVLRWCGRCSFSLYLWQQPFFMEAADGTMNRLAMGALAVLCGALSFYLFEDPVRRFLNQAWNRRRPRVYLEAAHAGGEGGLGR